MGKKVMRSDSSVGVPAVPLARESSEGTLKSDDQEENTDVLGEKRERGKRKTLRISVCVIIVSAVQKSAHPIFIPKEKKKFLCCRIYVSIIKIIP